MTEIDKTSIHYIINNLLTDMVKIDQNKLKKQMSNDFLNSRVAPNYNDFGFLKKNEQKVGTAHNYRTNANGFRCRELDHTDLLFAGCSVTFGVGIQEDAIWGNQIAKKIDCSAINLSEPGVGVDTIINYIFTYLKKYDNPKIILCLFPDFGRMVYPIVRPLISSRVLHQYTEDYDLILDHTIRLLKYQNAIDRPLYDKKPYLVENTVPYELPFFNSINKIMLLDQYCKSHNIKFYWGTWETDLNNTISNYNNIENIYDNFVFMDLNCWVSDKFGNEKFIKNSDYSKNYEEYEDLCHNTIKKEFKDTFYSGLDNEDITDYKIQRPHLGSHKHAHFAESFLNVLGIN